MVEEDIEDIGDKMGNGIEKYVIRIHTMLGRIKLYEVTAHKIENNELVLLGTNTASGHQGEFHYPIANYEHYNVIRDYDNLNELR